jgi:hypothetical protein
MHPGHCSDNAVISLNAIREFFKLLKREGLSSESVTETLAGWSPRYLHKFIEKCVLIIFGNTEAVDNSPVSFDFFPTSYLAAQAGCDSVQCRLERADHLARFSALYADRVFIANPFDKYLIYQETGTITTMPLDDINSVSRYLLLDIHVMLHLRQLLLVGIIRLYTKYLCKTCHAHIIQLQDSVKRRIEDLIPAIYSDLLEGKFSYEVVDHILTIKSSEFDDFGYGHFRGAEGLLSDEYILRLGSMSERERYNTIMNYPGHALIGPMLNDIATHELYNCVLPIKFLTDKTCDIDILNKLHPTQPNISSGVMSYISYSLPYLHTPSINSIIDLRNKEGEAFQIYRYALNSILDSTSSHSPRTLKEQFEDIIVPELNKMDLTVKNARKLLAASIKPK